jgi:hypothetical protein
MLLRILHGFWLASRLAIIVVEFNFAIQFSFSCEVMIMVLEIS